MDTDIVNVKCLTIIMLICIKQHLSNIWSLIHKKVKQHACWVEKSVAYKKGSCETLNVVKPVENTNKNPQSLLVRSNVQREFSSLHKLQYHAYE